MIDKNGNTILVDSFNLKGDVSFKIISNKDYKSIRLVIQESNFDNTYSSEEFSLTINNPILWNFDNPFLYHYELYLDKQLINGTFAFRTLSHDKHNVYLNNKPIFIRGYIRGADAHEHQNNINTSNAEFYRKNIRQAKAYGFNLIRFHSVVPSDEFLQVADEEGILVHLELRQPDDSYNNLEEMLASKNTLVDTSFLNHVIDSYFNHPSLAVYCIGNEIKGLEASQRCCEIGKHIKDRDPSRLFLDTCAWGHLGRPNVDIDVQHLSYFFPFGKHEDMYSNPQTIHTLADQIDKLQSGVSPFHIPLIGHEICHYAALRDFQSLREKFKHYNIPEPWWISEELKLIHEKGFDNQFDEMYNASKYFQLICWKEALEKIRKSPILGGFHFLQFADTDRYENSNGVVDCFDDANYVTPEMFRKFNDDAILTASQIKKIYRDNETLTISINLSNYGRFGIKKPLLSLELVDNDQIIHSKKVVIQKDVLFGNSSLETFELDLPKLQKSKQLCVKANLFFADKNISNEWNLWVYPATEYISYKDFVNQNEKDYSVTNDIETALKTLKEGKRTLLIYRSNWTRHLLDKSMPNPKYAFEATWNRFKPVIWDRGTNFGGIIDPIINRYGFASSKYYDFNYSVISEDADKIILDNCPFEYKNYIEGIDKCNRDRFDAYKNSFNLPELMPDRTLRHFSYLFAINVEGTPLLITGMNLTHLDEGEPSTINYAEAIKEILIKEEVSLLKEISLEQLEKYLKECSINPVKERMMTQYWELDNAPVESKQYWADSRLYLTEKKKEG